VFNTNRPPSRLLFPRRPTDTSVKSAHRADVVEYRIEQHKTKLGDRLSRMFAVTSGKQRKVRTVA